MEWGQGEGDGLVECQLRPGLHVWVSVEGMGCCGIKKLDLWACLCGKGYEMLDSPGRIAWSVGLEGLTPDSGREDYPERHLFPNGPQRFATPPFTVQPHFRARPLTSSCYQKKHPSDH